MHYPTKNLINNECDCNVMQFKFSLTSHTYVCEVIVPCLVSDLPIHRNVQPLRHHFLSATFTMPCNSRTAPRSDGHRDWEWTGCSVLGCRCHFLHRDRLASQWWGWAQLWLQESAASTMRVNSSQPQFQCTVNTAGWLLHSWFICLHLQREYVM